MIQPKNSNILKKKIFYLFSFAIILFSLNNQTFSQIEDDDEEIKIDSSLVVLNATITDRKGETNTNLAQEQFEVFEDGIKQTISFFSKQDTPFAAVILIDTSGSMEQRVSMARSAAIKFLEGIRDKDNVAIYNFDTKISLVRDFSNLRDLNAQSFDLKANGWTVLNDAVYMASKKLDARKEKRKAIVVLSDGADTLSRKSSNDALKAALSSNITLYTVDMSMKNFDEIQRDLTPKKKTALAINRLVLKKFAEKTGGQFVETPGGQEMRKAFESIVEDLGVQYTIGYHPSNSKNNGKWRKIDLKVDNSNLQVRTREGYNAPK